MIRAGSRGFSTSLFRRSQPLMNMAKPSQPMMVSKGLQKPSEPRKFTRDMYGSPVFEDSVLNAGARAERLAAQEVANAKLEGGDALLNPYTLVGLAFVGFCPLMYFNYKEQVSPVTYTIDYSVDQPKFVQHQSMATVGEGAFHGLLKNAHGERGKPETGFALKPTRPNTLANESVPMRRMASQNTDFQPGHHMKRVPSLEKRGFYEKTGKEKLLDESSTSSVY